MSEVLCEFGPTHLSLLATPVEPFSHHFNCQPIKPCDARIVFADAIVLEMTSQFGCKDLPPVFGFDPVSDRFEPIVHLSAFCRELFATRLSPKLEITFAREIAIMRKPQKVECVGFAVLFYGVLSFKTTEGYSSAFCRINFQTVLVEPVLQRLLDALCIVGVADYADKIISVSHKLTKSPYMVFDRCLKPFIEHIMQKYIC